MFMPKLASVLAGAFALFILALPNAAAAQCNCANSSLMGDQVSTRVWPPGGGGVWPTVNSTVSGAVEIPSAAALGMGAGPPRWSIDYAANTITATALQQPAGYAGNMSFKYSNLSPIAPAGCSGMTPKVVGISVTTNKPGVPWVASSATFTATEVIVPYAPPGGGYIEWNAGEFIKVTLKFACDAGPGGPTPTTFDSCCPPWNSTQLINRLAYQGTTIGQPYTLKFQNTAPLNTQMNAYMAYISSLGMGFTNITINFSLWNHGTGATPSGTGAVVSGATGSMVWTGTPVPTFFPNGIMQVGTWYRVRTKIVLGGGPANWLSEKCLESYVDVRVQAIAGMAPAPGQPGARMGAPGTLQFRLPNGTIIERSTDMPRDDRRRN